jgi:exodeoxyribonuclease V
MLDPKFLEERQLTDSQEKAVCAICEFAKTDFKRSGVMQFTGFAGTGKTTTMQAVAKRMGGLIVLAPTGKAATRVTEATGLEASTIHRYLYKRKEDPNTGEVTWILRLASEVKRPSSGLLVIDEASMVDEALWNDIYEMASMLHINVLVVGDPAQLSPVTKVKDAPFFSLVHPRFKADRSVTLTEIIRQAADNPIIKSSMLLRQGNWMDALMMTRQVPSSKVLQEAFEVVQAGGVILCHQNATRHYFNREIRKHLGYGNQVMSGEPLLITKNSYDINRFNGESVTFPGWEYLGVMEQKIYDSYNKETYYSKFGRAQIEGKLVSLAEQEIFGNLDKCSSGIIAKTAKRLNSKEVSHLHTNFAYCLTVHKFQGSESPRVFVVLEPSVNLEHEEGRRFAYTAWTRSSSELSYTYGFKVPT